MIPHSLWGLRLGEWNLYVFGRFGDFQIAGVLYPARG